MFVKFANANAPWMNKRVKCYDVPYMNCELRGLIAERDQAKTLANKTQDTDMFKRFKTLCNKVTSLNRQLKDEYYSTLVLEYFDNQDRL